MNIAERGEFWSRYRPDAEAIKVAGEVVSYGELAARVRGIAGGLAARGIQPGDRVGILAANSVNWCELALGTLHVGAIAVPLNIRMAPPELAHALDLSGCRAVGYDSTFAELYTAGADGRDVLTIALDGQPSAHVTLAEIRDHAPAACAPRADDDPAVLAFTSGTTGFPKAATVTHANLAAHAYQWALGEDSLGSRRTLLPVPLAFTGGIINNFLSTYAVGGTLVLEREFVPARTLELLVSERITAFMGVPVMWQGVAEAPGFADADLAALSSAVCGGAPVPRALVDAFLAKGVAIRQAYALTEATGSVCSLPHALTAAKPGSAGVPHPDTHVRLIDDEGQVVDRPGVVGEITVQGPQVMAGYWENPDATAVSIRDGWLFTGDAGQFNEDGCLEVVDRIGSMFVSGGLNVYPAEVERVVGQFAGVLESSAFGVPHSRWGQECGVVVYTGGVPIDREALIAFCHDHLSDYKRPRHVVHTDEPLPRGMSGKILRQAIVERFVPAASASDAGS